jgi:hypothetical protein
MYRGIKHMHKAKNFVHGTHLKVMANTPQAPFSVMEPHNNIAQLKPLYLLNGIITNLYLYSPGIRRYFSCGSAPQLSSPPTPICW